MLIEGETARVFRFWQPRPGDNVYRRVKLLQDFKGDFLSKRFQTAAAVYMSLSFQPALYQNAACGTYQRQFAFNLIFGAAFF